MKTALMKTLAFTLALSTLTTFVAPVTPAVAGGGSWCPLKFEDCSPAEQAFYIEVSRFKAPVLEPAGPRIAIRPGLAGSANVIFDRLQAPLAAREKHSRREVDVGCTR